MKCYIGDYVMCLEIGNYKDDIVEFLANNIGHIISINYAGQYVVEFNNIPTEIFKHFDRNNCRKMDHREIIRRSTSLEDLEISLNIIKYNL